VPGFGLRVAASGQRTWFLFYRDKNGRQKRFKIGTLPPMGLAKAREAARTQLLDVQVNEADPAAAKKARRSADTFRQLADRFIEDYAEPHKRSWRDDARQLRSMVLPKWKTRAASDITRADVRDLLKDVANTRGGVTANRLRSLLSKLFRWSVSQDYLPANPASELPKLTGEKARDRVLTGDEIKALWTRLEATEENGELDPAVALWLRLRLLTGQRGSTVARMMWAHLDLKEAVWEIPAEHMKAANQHVVPLSPLVVKLLKARRKVVSEGSTYVLEGGRGRRQRLGVTEAVRLEDFQPRDLRRTAASGMARAGASRFTVARVLGHIDRSVTGVYDRYEYLNEKRIALDGWSRVVSSIVEGKKRAAVVPFNRG
jgi:integrase